jgi:hypothetical protein
LLDWMTASTSFPGRIKGQLPAGTRVAHKTGTSGTADGITAATNDAGLVTLPDGSHLALAVFMKDSADESSSRDDVIARMTRAAYDCWARRAVDRVAAEAAIRSMLADVTSGQEVPPPKREESRGRLPVPGPARLSLEAKGVDRIESRSAPRRVVPEDEACGRREGGSHDDRVERDQRRPTQRVRQRA